MSEQKSNDKLAAKENGGGGKDGETTSSEDGWLFTLGKQDYKKGDGTNCKAEVEGSLETETSNSNNGVPRETKYFCAKNIPRTKANKGVTDKEPISYSNKKLVDRAEELFRCKPKSWRAKHPRIKLGKDERPLDSCDASGECTDDSEESQSSEYENEETFSLGKRAGSNELIDKGLGGNGRADRFCIGTPGRTLKTSPWAKSNSSLSKHSRGYGLKARASMSESALNQVSDVGQPKELFLRPAKIGKMVDTEDIFCSNSGSFTNRRKKIKIRKRSVSSDVTYFIPSSKFF